MKKRKLLTLIGSICLSLVLAALLLPACAPAAPEEVAEEIAELEGEVSDLERDVSARESEIASLKDKLVKAEAAAAPVPIEPEYKIAFGACEVGPRVYKSYQLFTDLVNERSDGRVEMTFYGHATICSLETGMDQCSVGTLEMAHYAACSLSRYVPWSTIGSDLPFAWTNMLALYRWWENIWVPELNKDLAASNLMVLPAAGMEGMNVIYSRAGPIHSPADCEGKIFRAFAPGICPMWMELLSGKSTVLPWAELYTALETGVIDIMHNPPGFGIDFAFCEVCPDVTAITTIAGIAGPIAGLEWWNSLPEDIQDLINDCWTTASCYTKWTNWNCHYDFLEQMVEMYNTNVYYPTDEEVAEFKAAVAPVFDWAREEYGDDRVDLFLDYAE